MGLGAYACVGQGAYGKSLYFYFAVDIKLL